MGTLRFRRAEKASIGRTSPISTIVVAFVASLMADIVSAAISRRSISTPLRRFEALTAQNDLELYDLQADPEEVRNLATDP